MAHELLPFLDKEEQKAEAKSKEPKDLEAFMNEERSAIANNVAPADEAYSQFHQKSPPLTTLCPTHLKLQDAVSPLRFDGQLVKRRNRLPADMAFAEDDYFSLFRPEPPADDKSRMKDEAKGQQHRWTVEKELQGTMNMRSIEKVT
ncbi:hypothetical protein HO133_001505 [Letharia lupina]|uniref:Uncharacterized protein n=1 Tax=Letharia lupina TaxID=560253 RepID=A0A8H6CFB0_9LECA|nr:uncharacterized protein HO133_001505 [Letharia lupina]KAF6222419.1 hypothetical protein HO133_001505 [Letharia lupina]